MPSGYLATSQRRTVTAEQQRRQNLGQAIRESLRPKHGHHLSAAALRHHLATYHGSHYSKLSAATLLKACHGIASISRAGRGRKRHLIGVELRTPQAKSLITTWEDRLRVEGFKLEPSRIPRDLLAFDPSDVPQAGEMYRGGDGVHRVQPNPEALGVIADTRNEDGTRGRPRRHLDYLKRLKVAAASPALTRQERTMIDVLAQGGTQRDVAERLGLRCSRARDLIVLLHRKLGIQGPGRGR